MKSLFAQSIREAVGGGVVCRRCFRELAESEFGRDRSRTSTRNLYCKECIRNAAHRKRVDAKWDGTAVHLLHHRAGRDAFSMARRTLLDGIEREGGEVWVQTPEGVFRWGHSRKARFEGMEEWFEWVIGAGKEMRFL